MAQPTTVDDTVVYAPRNLHLDKNVQINLLDNSQLDVWGQVFVNGQPLATIGMIPIASKAEAEAGVDNTKAMTPLRTKEAIIAQGDVRFVNMSGDTMTGDLTVSSVGGAVNADQVIGNTILYSQGQLYVEDGAIFNDYVEATFVPTMPGHLTNKAYVDSRAGSGGPTDGNKGDITVSGTGTSWQLNANSVGGNEIANSTITGAKINNLTITNDKFVQVSTNTLKGRKTASTGEVEDLTPANARLVLASDAGGTTNFFRADGTFAAPPAGGSSYVLNVKDYGAVGNGVADDTAAVQAAITAANTSGGTIFFPIGTYKVISTLVFSNCDVESASGATIVSSASPAVQLGSVSPDVNLSSHSLKMPRLLAVTADTGIGLKLIRAYHNNIWLPSISGFADGIYIEGNGAGVTYNTFTVGTIASYNRNLVVASVSGGWGTQNTFIGGRWLFTRSGTAIAGVRQIQFGLSSSDIVDGTTFIGCSFEGDQPQYHIEAYGNTCLYLNCRFETGVGSPRFSFQGTAIGNRFINAMSSQTGYAAVTSSATARGNVLEGVLNAEYHEQSGTDLIKHHTASGTPVEMVFAYDQDIYAATSTSTNYRIRKSADDTRFKGTADTFPRLQIDHTTGDMVLGSGSATNDVQLRRAAAGTLSINGNAAESRADFYNTSNAEGHRIRLATDVTAGESRIVVTRSSGAAFPLHILLDSAAKVKISTTQTEIVDKLMADGEIEIDGALNHDGTTVGFYGTTPVTKPTSVTARAALEALGLGATLTAEGGAGVTDGDKGDIVVSGTGATWMFDTSVVTAAAKTVLDDTTTDAMLATLGAQPKSQTVNNQTGTAYTLALVDAGSIVTLSNAAAITLTVPTNASVALPVGSSIDLVQINAGQVTVAPAGGVTINKSMATLKARAQYSVLTLVKVATDSWILTGDAAIS